MITGFLILNHQSEKEGEYLVYLILNKIAGSTETGKIEIRNSVDFLIIINNLSVNSKIRDTFIEAEFIAVCIK